MSHQLSVVPVLVNLIHPRDGGGHGLEHVEPEEAVRRARNAELHVLQLVRLHVGGSPESVYPQVPHDFPVRQEEALFREHLGVAVDTLRESREIGGAGVYSVVKQDHVRWPR